MKILVTGGAGYIGSHTVLELLQEGYEVVIVDNFSNSTPRAIDQIEKAAGRRPEFYEADLCNITETRKIFNEHTIDAVIHFAGLKAAGESVEHPVQYYYNNLVSSLNIFKLMQEYHVKKMIFSSSATVYGASINTPYTEEEEIDFSINPYGRSKAMIELIIEDMVKADSTLGVVILRYFNPLGASETGLLGEISSDRPNNLMPFITKVAAGELDILQIFGNDYDTPDGTGIRDYLHIVDLAKGHLKALQFASTFEGIEIFNLGSGEGTSVLDLVHAFEQATGMNIPYRVSNRRKGDIAISMADPSKAREVLEWETKKTIKDMCLDSWSWQKKDR